MLKEPEILFHNMDSSERIEAHVRDEIEKLTAVVPWMQTCRVVLGTEHRHHHKGNIYTVKIHVGLPDARSVTSSRDPGLDHAHEDINVSIRDSFAAVRRQLQDVMHKVQDKTKRHAGMPHGRVAQIFAERDYGFIETDDGMEIYFHKNSVKHHAFDDMKVGDEVAIEIEEGDKGPQAAAVRRTAKHHDAESPA